MRVFSIFFMFCVFGMFSQNNLICKPLSQDKKVVFIIQPLLLNNNNYDGVTRISFDIYGEPHTSNRIDNVVLYKFGKPIYAIDIDGVDFKRYFQWEDDGILSMEVDFPKQLKLEASDSVTFITAHGNFTSKLGKIKVKQ